MAYAQTRAQGYFVASRFDMPSTDLLLSHAFKIGLVLDNPQGKGRVWHDILTMPTKAEAKKLYIKYQEEQAAARDRAAAKRREAAAAKAKAKAEAKIKAIAEAVIAARKNKKTPASMGADAKQKQDKISQDMDTGFGGMYHRGTTTNDRLIRIEAKVSKLLSIWDESKSSKS